MKDLLIYNKNVLTAIRQPYILIFKTNIRFKKDMSVIAAVLEKHPSVFKWNVDRLDIDKLLRIESVKNNSTEIKLIIREAGYYCDELPE